jgi:hypothetical protein
MSREKVEFGSLETHVEILHFDPFPIVVKKRYDNCSDEAIVTAVTREFGDDLIAIVTYDISVVTINCVKYKSEPLNKKRWSKTA